MITPDPPRSVTITVPPVTWGVMSPGAEALQLSMLSDQSPAIPVRRDAVRVGRDPGRSGRGRDRIGRRRSRDDLDVLQRGDRRAGDAAGILRPAGPAGPGLDRADQTVGDRHGPRALVE